MPDILKRVYDKVSAAGSLEQYQTVIAECIEELESERLKHVADSVRNLSAVSVNRFSRTATQENFESSKKEVLAFLKKEKYADQSISEEVAVKIVVMIMEHFHDYCKCLYKEKIHKKCNDFLKKNLPCLKIENEYDVQRLMYPVIRSIFTDARPEETEDSGHHMVRKDIVIDSHDIVVELKCSGKAVTERKISEEIAADIVHYGNKNILFYIFDKANVIKNAVDFQKSYESKQIENKQIVVRIWQSNDI